MVDILGILIACVLITSLFSLIYGLIGVFRITYYLKLNLKKKISELSQKEIALTDPSVLTNNKKGIHFDKTLKKFKVSRIIVIIGIIIVLLSILFEFNKNLQLFIFSGFCIILASYFYCAKNLHQLYSVTRMKEPQYKSDLEIITSSNNKYTNYISICFYSVLMLSISFFLFDIFLIVNGF